VPTETEHRAAVLDAELAALRGEVGRLQAENARLLRLLDLTPQQAHPPAPEQTAIFDTAPGAVHARSPAAAKVAFYAALLGARTDTLCAGEETGRPIIAAAAATLAAVVYGPAARVASWKPPYQPSPPGIPRCTLCYVALQCAT
jgi:hypothetical protein